MKLAFIDMETTGTNHLIHTIWNFAAVFQTPGHEPEAFSFRCSPVPGAILDPKSLELGGVSKEELLQYEPPKSCLLSLRDVMGKYVDPYNKLDKFYFLAYNSPFDMNFLREWFRQLEDSYFGSWFWFPDICIMRKAAHSLIGQRHRLSNFQLLTVAKHLGLEVDEKEAHDALYDVELAREIYTKIT